jgi:Protein of unknown function (DUF3489)
MRQKRRKRFPMTNKTSKTGKPNQTQATVNEEPHTTASVAEQGAIVASSKAASKKVTNQNKDAAQGRRKAPGKASKPASAKAAAPRQPRPSRKKTATADAPTPRAPKPESKGAQLLALIGRDHGASLTELKEATGWQAHSVRGFLSTANKKQNLKISSIKNEVGERVYKTGQ